MPAKPPPPEKPKEERVRETITILNKLKEVGIADTDPGYLAVKGHMSEWIKTGEASTHQIVFPRHDRKGELTLPRRADRAAGLALKVIR